MKALTISTQNIGTLGSVDLYARIKPMNTAFESINILLRKSENAGNAPLNEMMETPVNVDYGKSRKVREYKGFQVLGFENIYKKS